MLTTDPNFNPKTYLDHTTRKLKLLKNHWGYTTTILSSAFITNKILVFITFSKNSLERCQANDYVEVYDGPSVDSQSMGKVCDGSQTSSNSFSSSTHFMTVVFHSDGGMGGMDNGFSAEFQSILRPTSGKIMVDLTIDMALV